MQKLILLRHAKSSWESPSLEDHARPLNARGREAAPKIGAWLQSKGHLPDRVLCSDALRTRQTLDLLGLKNAQIQILPELYLASAQTLLAHIDATDAETLLVIAHNPGIGALAAQLAQPAPAHPQFERFPTAATLVLERNSGEVIDFVVPRAL